MNFLISLSRNSSGETDPEFLLERLWSSQEFCSEFFQEFLLSSSGNFFRASLGIAPEVHSKFFFNSSEFYTAYPPKFLWIITGNFFGFRLKFHLELFYSPSRISPGFFFQISPMNSYAVPPAAFPKFPPATHLELLQESLEIFFSWNSFKVASGLLPSNFFREIFQSSVGNSIRVNPLLRAFL